jgi:hypothetical protein
VLPCADRSFLLGFLRRLPDALSHLRVPSIRGGNLIQGEGVRVKGGSHSNAPVSQALADDG